MDWAVIKRAFDLLPRIPSHIKLVRGCLRMRPRLPRAQRLHAESPGPQRSWEVESLRPWDDRRRRIQDMPNMVSVPHGTQFVMTKHDEYIASQKSKRRRS